MFQSTRNRTSIKNKNAFMKYETLSIIAGPQEKQTVLSHIDNNKCVKGNIYFSNMLLVKNICLK